MKPTLIEQLAACSDSTTAFGYAKQPYYVRAPAFDDTSSGIRLLHELCSLLNQLGYEAYVDTLQTHGRLWTPPLSAAVQRAHYLAGKKPIVIYPEIERGHPLGLGLAVRYALYYPGRYGGGAAQYPDDEILFKHREVLYPRGDVLHLPTIDLELFCPPAPEAERNLTLLYYKRYSGALNVQALPGTELVEISSKKPVPHRETAALYQRARVMYAYEGATATLEARLCGCPVVLLPNEQKLPALDEDQTYYGVQGLAWGTDADQWAHAQATVKDFRASYLATVAQWKAQLAHFIERTQALAHALDMERAWPQTVRDQLPGVYTSDQDLAARADRLHWQQLHKQYQVWRQRSSLREIDADIYAEHLHAGHVQALSLVIDQRRANADALADTLDSLAHCLHQPTEVHILAHTPAPDALAEAEGVFWHICLADSAPDCIQSSVSVLAGLELPTPWVLLLRSGCRLSPNALLEWGLACHELAPAQLLYADEDLAHSEDAQRYPYFKPDANIELLRCINYLGPAVAINCQTWRACGYPLPGAELYAAALKLAQQAGRLAFGHIDTVLAHAGADAEADEAREFDAARAVLTELNVCERLQPLPRLGTWLPEHRLQGQPSVSLVVPSGRQTGYLRSLLQAVEKLADWPLLEVIVVCQHTQADEVTRACEAQLKPRPQLLTLPDGDYNHAAALNAGVARAAGSFVLICDDDTEPLHSGWLQRLVALAQQSDVGLVAPRLLSSKDKSPRVVGGPVFLGVQGIAASYCGEHQYLDEAGVYSRLQLTQDVSAVAGHCFLLRKAHWERVGGMRADAYPLFFPVLDLCLRLGALGLRHVWTPQSNWVHHGGKTLEQRRHDMHDRVRLLDQELAERQQMLSDWSAALAHDPNYNRHLSLLKAMDIEADIVIDWNPRRHERPRLLALPIHSGAGQYRVVEPLNALQDAGLAQSCVVLPMAGGKHRVLQALEVRRAKPDVLVLQHSVDDGLLQQVRQYKTVAPQTLLVQMVDDLLGEVPEKHPNRVFQSREGHQRMVQALRLSDRLVVTTEGLQKHYGQYLNDVRLVPNSLDRQWFGLDVKRNPPGQRLRVGWVGAGQHQGDLELIEPIVAEFASEVDWVFMGMCTEGIKPHLKEFHGFVPIVDYPAKMASLGLDIAIAPLEDNWFNQCKSNLRLLEYGAMGWPVVCSKVATYLHQQPPVMHCGTLDEWRAALRRLIDQPGERERLGLALHQWLLNHYRLRDLCPTWLQALSPGATAAQAVVQAPARST